MNKIKVFDICSSTTAVIMVLSGIWSDHFRWKLIWTAILLQFVSGFVISQLKRNEKKEEIKDGK